MQVCRYRHRCGRRRGLSGLADSAGLPLWRGVAATGWASAISIAQLCAAIGGSTLLTAALKKSHARKTCNASMAMLKVQCVQINLVGLINHYARNAMSLRLGMVVRVIGENLFQTAFISET